MEMWWITIYSIALVKCLRLLTIDEDLVEFIGKQGLARGAIIIPEELG